MMTFSLVACYNQDVLKVLLKKMISTDFYLKNRHILPNVINMNRNDKKLQEKLKSIAQKFDESYVNGSDCQCEMQQKHNVMETCTTFKEEETCQINKVQHISSLAQSTQIELEKTQQSKILKRQKLKQYRARFIQKKQEFIQTLNFISEELFRISTNNKQSGTSNNSSKTPSQNKYLQKIQDEKQETFIELIIKLNEKIQHEDLIKSSVSTDSQKQLAKISNGNGKSEQQSYMSFSQTRGYKFYFKNKYHEVNEIHLEKSGFIKTKNRNPLLLDFGFARFIYKNDQQLAHELIAMQLIKYLNKIFGKQYILEYEIIPQIKGALYEFVENSETISNIKKKLPKGSSLQSYLQKLASSESDNKQLDLHIIQQNFAQSLAGFCIAQFMFNIKDRNNANIMLRDDGTIFHIDLAFIFQARPGGMNFQSAPFKMTKQYVKALGGFDSDAFRSFETHLIQMVTKIYESQEQLLYKIKVLSARSKQIKCFKGFNLKEYEQTKIVANLDQVRDFVEELIDKSYDNWYTKKYDTYQKKVNDIEP